MFIAIGVTAMILFQVFINTGMNMGIAPVTGIPLPLISYGGTSMIIALAALGLLESVAVRRKKLQFEVHESQQELRLRLKRLLVLLLTSSGLPPRREVVLPPPTVFPFEGVFSPIGAEKQ